METEQATYYAAFIDYSGQRRLFGFTSEKARADALNLRRDGVALTRAEAEQFAKERGFAV